MKADDVDSLEKPGDELEIADRLERLMHLA
jgi:hypothetical protein